MIRKLLIILPVAVVLYVLSSGVIHYLHNRFDTSMPGCYCPGPVEAAYDYPIDWLREELPREQSVYFCHYYIWWHDLAVAHREAVSHAK